MKDVQQLDQLERQGFVLYGKALVRDRDAELAAEIADDASLAQKVPVEHRNVHARLTEHFVEVGEFGSIGIIRPPGEHAVNVIGVAPKLQCLLTEAGNQSGGRPDIADYPNVAEALSQAVAQPGQFRSIEVGHALARQNELAPACATKIARELNAIDGLQRLVGQLFEKRRAAMKRNTPV